MKMDEEDKEYTQEGGDNETNLGENDAKESAE